MEPDELIQLMRRVTSIAKVREGLIKLQASNPDSYAVIVDFYQSLTNEQDA